MPMECLAGFFLGSARQITQRQLSRRGRVTKNVYRMSERDLERQVAPPRGPEERDRFRGLASRLIRNGLEV